MNFARQIVSGNKARFRDDDLGVDLDLVYVTDRVIIMGYPAEGMEAFYRNSRHDARRFLEHRHGKKYWVFNFCPIKENSYPAEFFHGHLSRYPFPDHHAPPLAIMALATREIDLWLRGDSERVVVLHCKAGKGRSGTLACSYLLSLEAIPDGPQLQRSHTRKDWANRRAAEMMAAVTSVSDDDENVLTHPPAEATPSATDTTPPSKDVQTSSSERNTVRPGDHDMISGEEHGIYTNSFTTASPDSRTLLVPDARTTVSGALEGLKPAARASSASLDNVLALHSARRMKPPSKSGDMVKKGVSIPSQRRYLYYWSQVLSNASPKGFWDQQVPSAMRKVRILEINVRMEELGGARATAMKMVNKVLESATSVKVKGTQKGEGDVWISLARYDDGLVRDLEDWEQRTRQPGKMGRLLPGSEYEDAENRKEKGIITVFNDGHWDSGKMVRSFARLGSTSKTGIISSHEGNIKVVQHILHPLPQSSWIDVQKGSKISRRGDGDDEDASNDSVSTISDGGKEAISLHEVEQSDLIVDANREVRAKLYMGQVPMGWFWLIPTFHMSPGDNEVVHVNLKKSDVDFPLGAGAWLLDIDVALQWVKETDAKPPARQTSSQSVEGGSGEPGNAALVAGLAKLNIGGDVKQVVQAAQAAQD